MYDKHVPEESAWSTLCVNNCHIGYSRYISKTVLSALLAARRATRESNDINSKLVQMYQDGTAPQVCVRVEDIYTSPLSIILSVRNLDMVIINQFKEAGVL